jgi:hypothetical protein
MNMSGAECKGKADNKITFRVEFILTLFLMGFVKGLFVENCN